MGDRTTGELSVRGDTTVIKLSGELTQPDVPDVARELSGPVLGRPSRLILDLTDLLFMDSSGIALRLTLKRRSVEEDFDIKLAGLTDEVRDRLDRTGLLSMLLDDGPAPPPRQGGAMS